MNLINGNSNFIKDDHINFSELVNNTNTISTFSKNYQIKMLKIMSDEFNEKEQQWYIANLYIYIHFHPTTDFPINLENIFKMIGFANKGNAKRTLENNFIVNEDYKLLKNKKDEKKDIRGGHNEEIIMLNIDTFKNLCMLARTSQGKEIRKYYVKLENINNKIMMEEMKEMDIKLKETNKLLLDRDLELDKNKQIIYREIETDESFYIFQEKSNSKNHGISFDDKDDYIFNFKSNNKVLLEEVVNYILDKYKDGNFNCNIGYIKNIVYVIGIVLNTLKSTFQHISKKELFEKITEKLHFLIDENEIKLGRSLSSEELSSFHNNELIKQFLDNNTVKTNDKNDSIRTIDLYNKFIQNKIPNLSIDFENFTKRLNNININIIQDNLVNIKFNII